MGLSSTRQACSGASGPTQMSLADSVAYMAIMTLTGLEPMTVTSNLNINFLRPCIGSVVIAEGTILKMANPPCYIPKMPPKMPRGPANNTL